MREVSNFSPAMAVPITVKMPEPITAPMPSAVSDHGPERLLQAVLGLFRVADQLVDRLGREQLCRQVRGSCNRNIGCFTDSGAPGSRS